MGIQLFFQTAAKAAGIGIDHTPAVLMILFYLAIDAAAFSANKNIGVFKGLPGDQNIIFPTKESDLSVSDRKSVV